MASNPSNVYLSRRALVLGLAKLLTIFLAQLPVVQAAPIHVSSLISAQEEGKKPGDPSLWLYLSVAAALVLLGGAFAGLTIALMGQDEIYLQVIRQSGEGSEKRHADKVLRLLQRGKHWVLVTLLLSNVITNETLPIVLDRSLGGGWPAVLGSTVLIVIFGEIAPQSVCVRYGLPIGAWMSPFVLVLMYILAPIAWPTAKLLDYLLGEDHGTVYKKAGLKTLVSLHKSMGDVGQQLNTDEVTIISAVLDLKDKSVGAIMTPMDKVFTMSLDDVLDEETMDDILVRGYSRIPVHHPDNDSNFVGMLLVKMLITYDPEDAKPVRDFALATLPETRPDTSCLDIINFFQEGKSHMILVSESPGEDHGALGVVTLEDVIEELIGEEIVDESDVFVDVHKAIRRSMPAPRMRIPKAKGQIPRGEIVEEPPSAANGDLVDITENESLSPADLQRKTTAETQPTQKPKLASSVSFLARRRSSAQSNTEVRNPTKLSTDEAKEHLKHLGPSNLASRPKTTRFNTVKIKPGPPKTLRPAAARRISESATDFQNGIGEGIVRSGGKHASDAVQTLHQEGYGTLSGSPEQRRPVSASKGVQAEPDELHVSEEGNGGNDQSLSTRPEIKTSESQSTVGSLPDSRPRSRSPWHHSKGPARSGSITENIVDANGIRKVVLEPSSSSDSNEDDDNSGANKGRQRQGSQRDSTGSKSSDLRGGNSKQGLNGNSQTKKKSRRRTRKQHNNGEREPLLGER